jgi:DNA-binding NtrC family response regulator
LLSRGMLLLLSDIALPNGMTGIALASQAKEVKPSLRVLLTSGFSEGTGLGMPGAVPPEFPLLPKPYRLATLAETVHAALNRSRDP